MNNVLGIVVAYQHADIVEKTLTKISEQDYKSIDWVVWNNDGLDKTSIESKFDVIVHDSENILWTPALNAAISTYLRPHHDYILYMNHDIYLNKNTISRMIQLLENNSSIGSVAPVGVKVGGVQDHSAHKSRGTYKGKESVRATYLMGCVQLMKRSVWEDVGVFDESMPLGADDFDYSIRMKEAGYELHALCEDPIYHVGHVTKDSENWNKFNESSWKSFNMKYEGYFVSEEEAIGALWGSAYNDKYPLGTGLSEEEKIQRGIKKV